MKRLIAVIMSLTVILSFAACGNGKTKKEETPARKLLAEFNAADKELSALEIAEKLSQLEWLPFSGASMPVEEGYLNGFTAEITGFGEGAMFAPVIGSIPFIGYIFKVSENTEDFTQMLNACHDLRWNVCTQADEMVCAAVGDTVFFVMSPASFEE